MFFRMPPVPVFHVSMNSISLHRHELYELVWSEPMSRLAQKYGFSDVWLAKICKKYDIPRPGRGYWARRQAGERVPVTRLPKRADDPLIDIRIYPERPRRDKEPRSNLFAGKVPKDIVVPDVLTDPHPFIIRTARILASSKEDGTGILAPPKEHCLDVRVSRECVDRALRIMDTLVKALPKVGFTVSISQGSTAVTVGDVSLGISLREGVKRRRIRAAEHDLNGYYQFGYNRYADCAAPSGILFIMIDDKGFRYGTAPRKTWRDTESKRLEDCLGSFVSGLIKAANVMDSLKQRETTPTHTPEDSAGNETSEHI